jgi:hypothetical protein
MAIATIESGRPAAAKRNTDRGGQKMPGRRPFLQQAF